MKTTTRRYEGTITKGAISVKVDGRALPLRLGVRNHSPTGFSWGYNGSGPAQLALAILCDHLRAFAHDIPLAILAFVGGAKFTLELMRRGRGPAHVLREPAEPSRRMPAITWCSVAVVAGYVPARADTKPCEACTDAIAAAGYQRLKERCIARLPSERGWDLTGEDVRKHIIGIMVAEQRDAYEALRAWLGVPLAGGIEDVHRAWAAKVAPAATASTTGAAR